MSNVPYNAPYVDESEHALLDHTGVPGVPQSGATVDLSAYQGEGIGLSVGDEPYSPPGHVYVQATDTNTYSSLDLGSDGAVVLNGDYSVELHVDNNKVLWLGGDSNSAQLGFFGTAPNPRPVGVAVTAEAIHAALVYLGLIEGP